MKVAALLRLAVVPGCCVAATLAFAAGPVSFGEIKIGMSRTEIEGLAPDQPIRLAGPLSPYQGKTESKEADEEYLEGHLLSTFSAKPLKTVFRFKGGKLAQMSITVEDDHAHETMMNQIAQKYGKPEVEDRQKEEQCIYRNGNNFTVKNGVVRYRWTQDTPEGQIVTNLTRYRGGGCPPDLRYGSTAFGLNWLDIGFPKKVPEKKSAF